jgi:Leucine-rich repeat (LRR) protein
MEIKKLFILILFQSIDFITANANEEDELIWRKYIAKGSTTLDASNKDIKSINGIEKFSYLKRIYMKTNNIMCIDQLENLTSLVILDLSNNKINSINALRNMKSLTVLNLYKNQIVDLNVIENLKSLTYLNLNRNQIVNVDSLKNCLFLGFLDLSFNQIVNIDSLKKLTNLFTLILTNNKIVDIKALENLTRLVRLYFSNNEVVNIEALKNLKNLKQLFISNNKIVNIEALKHLSLATLYLDQNEILNLTDFNLRTKNQIFSTYYHNNSLKHSFVDNFNQIYIFDEKVDYFSDVYNLRRAKKYHLLQSVFLITTNNLYYLNCLETIDFMRRNYHLNLFYHEQAHNFFHQCEYLDLEF